MCAAAQETPAAAPTFGLTGVVINAVTGEPVPRALVQLLGDNAQRSALSDSGGEFHFSALSAGPVHAVARKPGFFNPQELSQPSKGMYSYRAVNPGSDTGRMVLKLVPEGILYGQVTGAGDEPIEHVQVTAKCTRVADGRTRWLQAGSAITQCDGSFRLANLRPGACYISVDPGANLRTDIGGNQGAEYNDAPQGRWGYRTVYYPEARELAAASAISVEPGVNTEVNFSLRPEPLYRVTGWLTGLPAGRGATAQLSFASGEAANFAFRFEPFTGAFTAEAIPAGNYVVHVNGRGEKGGAFSGTGNLLVKGEVSGVRIGLQSALTIPIRVQAVLANAATDSRRNVARLSVHLSSDDQQPHSDIYSSVTEDGALELRNVDPGTYSVDITRRGPYWIQAASCGGTDLLRDKLVVAPGAQLQPIEITLRDDVADLRGSVQSANMPQAAVVIAIPLGDASRPARTFAGERGDFHLGGLAPGEYNLFAFDNVDGLEYTNPEALREYESQATPVQLLPKDQKVISLELIARQK